MRLRIATPMYGGMCCSNYVQSLLGSIAAFSSKGIAARLTVIDNESLISRARNKLVKVFLDSDDTHLLFWDSDIGVDPSDLLKMLAYGAAGAAETKYSVIGGMYTTKGIDWHRVRNVAANNPAINPAKLQAAAGQYVYNTPHDQSELTVNLSEPYEVLEVGTGLMLIQRRVFSIMSESYPELYYQPQQGDTPDGCSPSPMFSYFESGVSDAYGQRALLSEDYAFCQRWRSTGGKVWIAPWTRTTHRGSYGFVGNFSAYLDVMKPKS